MESGLLCSEHDAVVTLPKSPLVTVPTCSARPLILQLTGQEGGVFHAMYNFLIRGAEGGEDARDFDGVAIDKEVGAEANSSFGTVNSAVVRVDWVR